MSVFGGLEDNAPDGSLYLSNGDLDDPEAPTPWASEAEATRESERADGRAAEASEQRRPSVPTELARHGPTASRKRKRRLAFTVTAIEPTKNEVIIWFDVQTSLPRFRNSSYRDVRRTHSEIRRFAEHLIIANPECFVPALPEATNSYPASSAEHDERLRQVLQKWFDRVSSSPLLTRDEEFLYFTEASFGYAPMAKIKPTKTGLSRKVWKQFAPPPDDIDELRELRPLAKLFYSYAIESHTRLAKVTRVRKALAADLQEFGTSVQQFSTGEDSMSHMWNRVSKALLVSSDAESARGTLQEATYGDAVALAARDAYIIKETLTTRHIIMGDLEKAQAVTREKHQKATRLKGMGSISPTKVDEAIMKLEDAAQLEKRVTSTLRRVSDNLVVEKKLALGRMEADMLEAIGSCALRFIEQERRTLAAWESARPDVRAADKNGGLSHLGRSVVSSPRRSRHSQGWLSDDWSDRSARAKDLAPVHPVSGSESEVLDKKSAASLLGESVF